MPLFRYEAMDRSGNTVRGTMQAVDEAATAARLQAMGYRPTTVLAPTARPASPSPLTTAERHLARGYQQLGIALRAGLPLFHALMTVREQVADRPLCRALGEIAASIQGGATLSGSMERFPRLFPRGDVGLVRAAEAGGFLPEALLALSARHEEEDNVRRRLRVWLWFLHAHVYGLILAICFVPFVGAAVAAGFDVGAGGRAVGRMLLFVGVPAVVLYTGLVQWLGRARRIPSLERRWHRLLVRVPVLGRLHELRAAAVFYRTLQQLHHAGLAAGTAWETATAAIPNLHLAERFAAGGEAVRRSASLSRGLAAVPRLPAADAGLAATGEMAGEVERALSSLAARYEEDCRVALGAAAVRGALTFVLWSFLLGALGLAVLAAGYYGTLFQAVEKAFGTE